MFCVHNTMRIMTGRAGGFSVHDVEAVAPILAVAVNGPETLISQDAVTAVAFVTERIIAGVLGIVVGQKKLTFQDRRKRRTVRAVRAAASGFGSLVVVVAVGAVHQAGGRPGSDEAWDIGVLAYAFDWMERLIGQIELK